ncbi:Hydroperoxide resistance conferring protein [Scheffersomyces stipitis CBS 6054]|uniref:Glutathione peroxidase n=1 Tax=Scheffersomyces stipitis (strain ATCC 58785 / CBS 6054 / NBRC 10063 / NRRL Y-11545) TaxID=322104 RepID=A3GFQ6_PICST|nr:Hydroperoxide resistance conferring gene. Sensor and transducer of the hydroperoxide signal to Yap1. Hydroperoxide receptor and redox-transducer [Scheffersomyces stipitis CBS 6054]EAZ63794.2 Hydroperoxide resistance conferring protein [Scheffersomyces stipitis CBS 6054]KAG2731726.1 hypothetical protein G9P44_005313 [Scheffersomyces stipitis]
MVPHVSSPSQLAVDSDSGSSKNQTESPFYSFKVANSAGKLIDIANYKGKVVLVVNVASLCGFTPQYKDLETLYQKYKDRGFEILAFPCNQFGSQEPEDEDKIVVYCQRNFGVTFPIMQKLDVNGYFEAPIYTWLKNEKRGVVGFKGLRWNFEKFLVDRSGNVVSRYLSTVPPLEFEDAIVKLLKA